MANQVTYANLFSESRNNVIALITTTNISDPVGSSAESRKRIYSRDPDVKASDFKGYPFIIVNPPEVDVNDEKGNSLDGKSKFVAWDVEIEIVTSDRGYGKNDGQGLSHMSAMSDDLMETFLNKTNRDTLSNNSMKFVKPVSNPVNTEVVANELVYRRSIMISFRSKIQVSS